MAIAHVIYVSCHLINDILVGVGGSSCFLHAELKFHSLTMFLLLVYETLSYVILQCGIPSLK